uniref:Ring finger and FYVE like domain containing E3 ubiquitin protein ligase n=1 Tax=Sus scrofa TaxID=9823 RepID=A0A8D1ATW7_PIG
GPSASGWRCPSCLSPCRGRPSLACLWCPAPGRYACLCSHSSWGQSPKVWLRSARGSVGRVLRGELSAPVPSLPLQSIDSEDSFVPGRRASLSDLTDLEDIEGLTVRQLKEILARNFVNYKGCCEKWELMERVTRLYKDQKGLQHLVCGAEDQNGGAVPSSLEENLCRICMDSPIDCVLLECGHMVTCTKCGKRMNECPICRQYVIRAVHVFRS